MPDEITTEHVEQTIATSLELIDDSARRDAEHKKEMAEAREWLKHSPNRDGSVYMIDLPQLERVLESARIELAAMTPDPRSMETRKAWEALCPSNEADRECLAKTASAIMEAMGLIRDAMA